jgi:hypothetical protein
MANTLLTPSIIAKEAIIALENNLVAAGLVHRDHSDEFANVGDTISVRKPATFTAAAYNGSTVSTQEVVETAVPVALSNLMDVTFAVTSKELSLSIQDFRTQLIDPAVRAHAQSIDNAICALYKDVPYFAASGDTAWTTLKAFTAPRKVLNDNKAPFADRKMLLGSTADMKALAIEAVVSAEKTASAEALRNAELGRIIGFNTFTDQNIDTHTAGSGTTAANAVVDLVAGYAVGDDDLHFDALSTALKVGDILVMPDGNSHVVTVAGTLSTADQDVTVYPALKTALVNDAVCTIKNPATAAEENLAFHKNAFALVTRPLAPPMGAAKVETVNWNGISLRVVYDYDRNLKSDVISVDCLWGVKTLTPELACRTWG